MAECYGCLHDGGCSIPETGKCVRSPRERAVEAFRFLEIQVSREKESQVAIAWRRRNKTPQVIERWLEGRV